MIKEQIKIKAAFLTEEEATQLEEKVLEITKTGPFSGDVLDYLIKSIACLGIKCVLDSSLEKIAAEIYRLNWDMVRK